MNSRMEKTILFLILISSCVTVIRSSGRNQSASATYKLIYKDVNAYVSCVRRFNGTHEIGCSTGQYGNVGVVQLVNDTASLDWLLNTGPNPPYTPIIPSAFFNTTTVKKLRESDKVNGMMVIMTDETDTKNYPGNGFSSDQQCPNLVSSIYEGTPEYSCQNHKFNPGGSGLMLENIGVPVVLLKSEQEVETIMDCYYQHNMPTGEEELPAYPLCSVEIKAFMHGAGNSEVCWRRNTIVRNLDPQQYCQQLGGRSSHAFLNENKHNQTRNDTIVVTTRIDSFSLFENSQPGTSSPAPGITVMLALAEALKPFREDILNSGYNILFLALTGEAWDYIGSQRVVYDMEKDLFPSNQTNEPPFHLAQIHIILELSHFINALDNVKQIYVHTDPNTARSKHAQITNFINTLKQVQTAVTVHSASAGQPLPPASSQMFIRVDEEDGVAAMVLADYDREYKTQYYNSYLDTTTAHGFYTEQNRSLIDYEVVTAQGQLLADIATTLARAIYKYTTSNDSSVTASNQTTSRLLYCFLVSPNCDIFKTVVAPKNANILTSTDVPFPFFVSVYFTQSIDNIQSLVAQMLAYYTGDIVDQSKDACENHSEFTRWMSGRLNSNLTNSTESDRSPICVRSTVQYHNAISPAFLDDNYNFSSTQYSTWTESVWPNTDAFHVRIFLQPSAEVELASMIAGISAFILTAVLTVLIQRRASLLFPPQANDVVLLTQSSLAPNPIT